MFMSGSFGVPDAITVPDGQRRWLVEPFFAGDSLANFTCTISSKDRSDGYGRVLAHTYPYLMTRHIVRIALHNQNERAERQSSRLCG